VSFEVLVRVLTSRLRQFVDLAHLTLYRVPVTHLRMPTLAWQAFQCPHTQRGSAAGDRSEKAAAREGEVAVVVDSEEEIARIMANCSILVGLHPDQATGDLVDYALAHNKPFAVVPCCTFHEHFRDRFLPSGKPVKSYADLVQWILAKDSRILKDELPTGGRNIVLHFLCQSPDQGPGAGAGEAPGGESSAALV
jgi:hypothetical protein